jgi:MerR family mercuric resistance operon transcriptional regulator
METAYTIGQLAHAAGVPTSTVRYYERIGLLFPKCRTAGNYRLYGAQALARLHFIRTAQATGFTLDDITALLQLQGATSAACQEVQTLIEARLGDIAQRLSDLRHVQRVLKATLRRCQETEWQGRCHILDTLTASAPSHS